MGDERRDEGMWTWIDFYISREKKNEKNIATDVDNSEQLSYSPSRDGL